MVPMGLSQLFYGNWAFLSSVQIIGCFPSGVLMNLISGSKNGEAHEKNGLVDTVKEEGQDKWTDSVDIYTLCSVK